MSVKHRDRRGGGSWVTPVRWRDAGGQDAVASAQYEMRMRSGCDSPPLSGDSCIGAIEPIGDRYFSVAVIGLLMEPRPIGGRPVTPQEPPNDQPVQDPDRRRGVRHDRDRRLFASRLGV